MKKILRIICVFVIVCLGVLGFSACGSTEVDQNKQYDSITKTLKLNKTYEGKNFFSDGIGAATLTKSVDGDTSMFNLTVGGRSVTIRYYSIDTPESTGGVEKWGKAASLFTKAKLEAATEIVLEASQTPATTDSYGTRYLGYVWYKTADYGEFKNLNLEVVENGYSENKGVNTNAFPYNNYFDDAQAFAKSKKLHLFAGDDVVDPLYSTEPVDITVEELQHECELYANNETGIYFNRETDSGAKVRFTAYLKSLTVSGTGTHTFVAEQYDPDTGKTYQVNVYTAYISSAASRMKLGHLYQIVGNIQSHYGTLQVSGIDYDSLYPTAKNTHIEQSNYYQTFDSTVTYTDNYSANYYSNLTVTSVSVDKTVMTIVASANKLTSNGFADEAKSFTFNVTVSEGYTPALNNGDKFSVSAYKFDKDSDVLTITDVSKIVKR